MIFIPQPTVSMYFIILPPPFCAPMYIFQCWVNITFFPQQRYPFFCKYVHIIALAVLYKKGSLKKKNCLKTCFWNNYLHFSIFLFMCYILVDFFGKLLIVQGRVNHTSPGLKLAWFYALDCHNLSPPSSHKMDEWRDTIK